VASRPYEWGRRVRTPRVVRMMSIPLLITFSVRSNEAPGGSCNDVDQVALILLRDEAGGAVREELQARNTDQRYIDHEKRQSVPLARRAG